MTDLELTSISEVAQLSSPTQLGLWLPGAALALAAVLAARVFSAAIALPLTLLTGSGLFLLVASKNSETLDSLTAKGWLLGPFAPEDTGGFDWVLLDLLIRGDWSIIAGQWSSIGTVLVISALSILLTISALALPSEPDIDVNCKLRVAGLANLTTTGCLGGMVGFRSLSISSPVVKLGMDTRTVALVAAATCGLIWCFGTGGNRPFVARPSRRASALFGIVIPH